MALYVIQARGADTASLERATLIKDGFSWPAFFFAQLWLIYHRLWVPLLIWILAEIAFTLVVLPHVAAGTFVAVDFLAHLFIGFEGNRLRIGKGARRAIVVDVVEARDRDAAEARFFDRLMPATAAGLEPQP